MDYWTSNGIIINHWLWMTLFTLAWPTWQLTVPADALSVWVVDGSSLILQHRVNTALVVSFFLCRTVRKRHCSSARLVLVRHSDGYRRSEMCDCDRTRPHCGLGHGDETWPNMDSIRMTSPNTDHWVQFQTDTFARYTDRLSALYRLDKQASCKAARVTTCIQRRRTRLLLTKNYRLCCSSCCC